MTSFILDTSCLTQAFRVYYPFDIAPSFWEFIKRGIVSGRVIIIDKVHAEICRGNDDLKTWLDTEIAPKDIFHCDAATLTHYASIMKWGNGHQQYNYNAKLDFSEFDNADPFVVAAAKALTATVVSQETSAPSSVKNIKLPDVCINFNVPHLDTFSFLRSQRFTM
jgi:hypothetical protein